MPWAKKLPRGGLNGRVCKQPPNKLDKNWQSDCAKNQRIFHCKVWWLKCWIEKMCFGIWDSDSMQILLSCSCVITSDLSLTKRWIFRSRDRCCLRCQTMVKSRMIEPMFKIFHRNLQRMLPFGKNLPIEPQESQQFDRCPTKYIGKLS